jgi:DNA-directed RNA polymerase subunit RPC12/RpoP
MYLACPNRCSVNRFELWNASVYVDALGRYLEHRAEDSPLYRCTACGSPAVDLGEVPVAMAEDEQAELEPLQDYACPACEELFQAPASQNPIVCPACGQTFPIGSEAS